MNDRILVVGAGFAGACYARILAENGYKVQVIDARAHIAGNAFDYEDENGIRRHRYGPHLFHTSNSQVVDWLSQFTEWVPYEHRVRARLDDGRFVPMPINLETISVVLGAKINDSETAKSILSQISIPNAKPSNAGEFLYSTIGKELTDLFFRRYTKKMWDMDLEDMDASVVKRIPIRLDFEDRYFPNEIYQTMPRDGYTAIFDRIFDHPNIDVILNTKFDHKMEKDFDFCFNSMPIDDYYNFSLGELPYRSIKFHHRTSDQKLHQNWATTNFTDEGLITRETCWHLLPGHLIRDTGQYTYTSEEPCDYRDNQLERYYPVKTADGRYEKLYASYKELSRRNFKVSFIGRCGTYQYLDMHQVINQSLAGAKHWLNERRLT